jgi:hypothetical protein
VISLESLESFHLLNINIVTGKCFGSLNYEEISHRYSRFIKNLKNLNLIKKRVNCVNCIIRVSDKELLSVLLVVTKIITL